MKGFLKAAMERALAERDEKLQQRGADLPWDYTREQAAHARRKGWERKRAEQTSNTTTDTKEQS